MNTNVLPNPVLPNPVLPTPTQQSNPTTIPKACGNNLNFDIEPIDVETAEFGLELQNINPAAVPNKVNNYWVANDTQAIINKLSKEPIIESFTVNNKYIIDIGINIGVVALVIYFLLSVYDRSSKYANGVICSSPKDKGSVMLLCLIAGAICILSQRVVSEILRR